MRNIDIALEETGTNEVLCLILAAGIHLLILIWNPILMGSDFHATHDFVTVDVVEQPGSSLLPPAAPQKMSLMSTLKDMLLKPKMEEIAHVAPSMPQTQPVSPEQPALKERAFQPMTPHFLPTHTDNDQIAAENSPQAITPGAKMPTLPIGEPTLKTKSFGGIRAQDVPFQVSSQESLAANSVSAIPIAVGNQSAKAGLGYSAPALQETNHHALTSRVPAGIGSGSDAVALNAGQGPAPIALSGAGSNGNAPTGTPGNGGSLQQRSGGGLVSRGLGGYGGGSGSGSVLGAMPSAAQELDTQIAAAMNSGSKSGGPVSHKGFEISGPLTKRPIVNKVIPQYPAWAEEQGIIGSVRLYFTVTPEGAVRSYIRVTKTTGYQQLDQLAIDALKQWQFAPLSQTDDEGKGEWGIITFNFSLSS